MAAILILLACAADKTVGDTAAAAGGPASCPAFDVVEVGVWDHGTGVGLPQRESVSGTQPGVGVGDLDGDGWLDVLMAFGGGSLVLWNDGAGTLVADMDGTRSGLLPSGAAVALADLDEDGDLDAWLGRWRGQRDEVLWNDGTGRFTRDPVPGTEGATFTASFADVDADGDLDAFVAAGSENRRYEDIAAGINRGDPNLLLLQENGRFVDVTAERLPASAVPGISFQGAWLDAEGDGDLDLYVANDAGPFIEPNHLFLNDGRGWFTDASDCACQLATLSMGAAVGDPDRDGDPDLYLSDVGGTDFLNNLGDGSFVDASLASGAFIPPDPDSMTSWGTSFVDVDGDGAEDVVVTFGQSGDNFAAANIDPDWIDGEWQPDVILQGDGRGGFVRAVTPGFADGSRTRAVAVGDFDRDGRPDLVTAGKHFLRQWRTVGGCEERLTVRLGVGARALGARLDVDAAGDQQTVWMLPSTTASSNAWEAYVGLGGATRADVSVTWPDGSVERFEGLTSGVLDVSAE